MFKSLKLKNFRNFENKEFFFAENKNFILWNNWVWKTNILEAISLIYQRNILNKEISNLIKDKEIFSYIEIEKDTWDRFGISLDKESNSKKLLINWKKTTKKKFNELLEKVIIFKPLDMNMMYLSPSYRRDFLDDILSNSFEWYDKINKDYKNIVRNRNKLLKNIREWKCTKSEIVFWDKALINKSKEIYDYRMRLNSYFVSKIIILKELLWLKIDTLHFNYITKVDLNNIETSIENYLTKNLDRDIIIWNTHIWPHIDDFQITLDWFPLINFASRGETKSVILWLKIIESQFIEENTNKETIFLIDDLFSELDETHKKLLLSEISDKQVIITSIKDIFNNNIWDFIINL